MAIKINQKPAKLAAPGAGSPPRLAIRMYRHGLGDCMLLRFAKPEGSQFSLLIDCGLITVAQDSKTKMNKVAADINEATNGHIDVVVMTHEHWDHASGFSEMQARDTFDKITIGEVWYGWTEDPQNELGKRLRKERAEKVKALTIAMTAFSSSGEPAMKKRGEQIGSYLRFFGHDAGDSLGAAGAAVGRTRGAFEYLMHRRGVKTRYLYPTKPPLTLRGVPNLRVYVFGPPEDESYIKKSTPSKRNSEVYEFDGDLGFTAGLSAAFSRFGSATNGDTHDCPFDGSLRLRCPGSVHRHSSSLDELMKATWDLPGNEWRRIENDWTQAAENLALNLDTHTNNTCVVLAFEFTDTGEVFLFPADAQVGNWLSWQELSWNVKGDNGGGQVKVSDLLERTVFYKVGHHGSHNATLREFGLEQMTSDDLVAFIPVVEEEAKKNRWMNMPFKPLVERLQKKTAGRILRSDQSAPTKGQLETLPKGARDAFVDSVEESALYHELIYR